LPNQLFLKDAVSAIENSLPKCGQVRVVTIDGPAGSGKTTLATNLASKLEQASVIHLDELYEGWDKSLDQVLFERIQAWILKPLENGLPPKHLRYDDCHLSICVMTGVSRRLLHGTRLLTRL